MKDLMETDKIYFNPGDMVTLRQDIPNKPTMIVVKKETYIFNKNRDLGDSKDLFKGIREKSEIIANIIKNKMHIRKLIKTRKLLKQK